MSKHSLKHATEEQEIPAPPAPKPEAKVSKYPIAYYNPIIIDERFVIGDGLYRQRFRNGRFIATNEEEERAVRAALAIHGKDKPDRWMGDDMRKTWTCNKTGFTTANENAKDDYQDRRSI